MLSRMEKDGMMLATNKRQIILSGNETRQHNVINKGKRHIMIATE